MSKIIIGIDPDSKAHGVAKYVNGELIGLDSCVLMQLIPIIQYAQSNAEEVEFHIEDVCANNAIFRGGNGLKVQQSIARRLGMVQQSQVELERLLHHYAVKVVKHKISKSWKNQSGKKQFEKVTGWKSHSNEDTRSAAWMGYQGLNK